MKQPEPMVSQGSSRVIRTKFTQEIIFLHKVGELNWVKVLKGDQFQFSLKVKGPKTYLVLHYF